MWSMAEMLWQHIHEIFYSFYLNNKVTARPEAIPCRSAINGSSYGSMTLCDFFLLAKPFLPEKKKTLHYNSSKTERLL